MPEPDRSKVASPDVCLHMYSGHHFHRLNDDSKRVPVLGNLVVDGITVPNQVLGWQRQDSGNYNISCCRCDTAVRVVSGEEPPASSGEHWERGDFDDGNPLPRPAMEDADPAPAPAPAEADPAPAGV